MQYKIKNKTAEAVRWYPAKPHPAVIKNPKGADSAGCGQCNSHLALHGRINNKTSTHRVCAGDYIVEGPQGSHYPVAASVFEETHEPI